MGITMQDLSLSGMGLAFVGYPSALSMLPGGQGLFGVLFSLMFWFIGLSSAYSLAYRAISIPLMDKFGWSRVKTAAGTCIIAFRILFQGARDKTLDLRAGNL